MSTASGDRSDPFVRTLGPHIDALETARAALPTQPAASTAILRVAEALERSSEQHGFTTIHEAAQAVRLADAAGLGAATDKLLYALLSTRVYPGSREQTVLVVDDDVVLNRLLTAILQKPGRRLQVATTAAAILEALRTRRVDLMILDLGLPDLDGRLVLSGLRKNHITAVLPVLVVSASTESWVESECIALGAAAFVRKPFDPVVLAAKVTELLEAPTVESVSAVYPPAPEAEAASAPHDSASGPIEVLLAEHDPLTAQIIRHRLGREGMIVRHFASGTAALQAAKTMVPGLVILDAMTPGIEGIELLTRLRALPKYRRIPILVLSDIGSEREVVRALGAGADECIKKPFSPTELMARIERLLQRK